MKKSMISILLGICVVLSHAASGQDGQTGQVAASAQIPESEQGTISAIEEIKTTVEPKKTTEKVVQIITTNKVDQITSTKLPEKAKNSQENKDDKDNSHQIYIISVIFITFCSLIYIV